MLAMAANFSIVTAVSMLMSTLPLYVRQLGGSSVMSGLVVGVYAFTALLCRPVTGRLADKRGRRPVMLGGMLLLLTAFLSMHAAVTVSFLLAVRIIQGAGFSAHSTAAGTIIADVVPSSRLAEGVGYYGISNTLPTAFGPSLGLYLIAEHSYEALFGCAAVCAAAGLLLALFIRYEQNINSDNNGINEYSVAGNTRSDDIQVMPDRQASHLFFESAAVVPGLVMFFVALGLGGIMTFLPQYAASRKIEGIGLYFTVYAGALLLSRLFSGRMADRRGTGSVVYPGLALIAASFVVLAYSVTLAQTLGSALMFGIGFGSVQPAMNALVIRRASQSRRGAASALFTASMDLGMGAGSILWGAMSQSLGYTKVYLACALCAVLSSGVYLFLISMKHQRPVSRQ